MQALRLRLAGRRCGPKAADGDCVNIGKVAQAFAWGTEQTLVPQIGCGSGQNGRPMEQEASLRPRTTQTHALATAKSAL